MTDTLSWQKLETKTEFTIWIWVFQYIILKYCCLVAKSCPTLHDPMDCCLPGSSVHGIFWAFLENRLTFPSLGYLPDPGIELESPALQADSSTLEKEMATHSSILAWKIPWTEEPGGLQFIGSQRAGQDWTISLSLSFALPLSLQGSPFWSLQTFIFNTNYL